LTCSGDMSLVIKPAALLRNCDASARAIGRGMPSATLLILVSVLLKQSQLVSEDGKSSLKSSVSITDLLRRVCP
jgi:hypothetical protein